MKDFRSQFRLPLPLADKLKTSAEANHRSLNAEIVERLGRSYSGGALSQADIDAIARAVVEQIRQ